MFGGVNKELTKKQFKLRNTTDSKHRIYPWNNYDFDYTQYIKNKYSPDKLGFSDKPYLSTLMKDITSVPKYPSILVSSPLLSPTTQAGKSDIDNKDTEVVNIKKQYDNFKEPYPGFKKEYPEYFPITGDKANNYFIQIGTCPVKKYKNKKECEQNGFSWHSDTFETSSRIGSFYNKSDHPESNGSCYKPRYLYIDNSNSDNNNSLKGVITDIGENIKDLNPMGLIQILMGEEPENKKMKPLKCIETFSSHKDDNFVIYLIIVVILFITYLIFT